MIARILAEKDTLRCQLVELQEHVFSAQARRGSRELRRPSCDGVGRASGFRRAREHERGRGIIIVMVCRVSVEGVGGGLGEPDVLL